MENNTVALDIQLQGEERLVGDFPARLGSHLKLLVPAHVKSGNISTVTRDTEILLDILKKHPREVGALVNAALAGDPQSASEIAKMLGISEEKFKAKGGGPLWLIVIVVILVLKACEGEANIIISPEEQKFLDCCTIGC